MSTTYQVSISGILPRREDLEDMARKRWQRPNVHKTEAARPSWYFRARIDALTDAGKMGRVEKTYHLGWCDEMGIVEARKRRDAILDQVNNTPLFVQSQVLFKNVVTAYEREFIPTLKPNSQKQYRSRIHRYVGPEFGDMQLHEVKHQQVQGWVNRLVATGLSKTAVKGIVAVLSSIMKRARAWEYTYQADPTEGVRVGECKSKPTEGRALTPDEVRRLLAVADMRVTNDGQGRHTEVTELADMIRIGIYCGLRISEILALTWGNYRPPAFYIVESRSQHGGETTSTKSKAGKRAVPAGPVVLKRPTDASDNDRIFTCEYLASQRALVRVGALAGIELERFGWHTMRRTYSTFRRKVSSSSMREAMGHADESMSEVYVRESFADDVDAVKKIEALVIGGSDARILRANMRDSLKKTN